MAKLEAVIRALDVERVIWIDDLFSIRNAEAAGDSITLAGSVLEAELIDQLGVELVTDSPQEELSAKLDADEQLLEKAVALLQSIGGQADGDQAMVQTVKEGLGCELLPQ